MPRVLGLERRAGARGPDVPGRARATAEDDPAWSAAVAREVTIGPIWSAGQGNLVIPMPAFICVPPSSDR